MGYWNGHCWRPDDQVAPPPAAAVAAPSLAERVVENATNIAQVLAAGHRAKMLAGIDQLAADTSGCWCGDCGGDAPSCRASAAAIASARLVVAELTDYFHIYESISDNAIRFETDFTNTFRGHDTDLILVNGDGSVDVLPVGAGEFVRMLVQGRDATGELP